MLNRPLPAPARDVVMLVGRVILGVVLFAHGWQKLMINGIAGTYAQFDKLGIPLAIVSASFAAFVEFVGGVLIIVGALTTTVVALDLVVMVGAAGFVHITRGIFAQNGGWELVGVIVAAELALAAFGPGRFSVDHLIARRHDQERDELQRRMRRPVRRAAGTSEAFEPVVEPAAARSYPSGAFAAVGPVGTTAPVDAPASTGAFAAVEPVAAPPVGAAASTGAFTAATASPLGAAGARAEAGSVTASIRVEPRAGTGVSATRVETACPPAAGAEASTGPVRSGVAHPPTAEQLTAAAGIEATTPRMASAGVHRAMAERSGRSAGEAPALFGVTVQSPLDFTPTTAMPVVPPTPVTEMIAIATTGPELPRRVRPYA